MSMIDTILQQIQQQINSQSNLKQPLDQSTNILNMLTERVGGTNADVTMGLFGEQSRLNRNIGTSIAAGGGGVGGTRNFLPIFQSGARFAGQRMQARNAAEQAKIMQFLQIAEGFGSVAAGRRDETRLGFEQTRLDREDDFNIANLLPTIGLNFLNPFGG